MQKAHPGSHSLSLLLAQLYAEEKRYAEATVVLESSLSASKDSMRHSPNTVFMIRTMHEKAGHPETSVKVLLDACAFWASTDPDAAEYTIFLKERAKQNLNGRRFEEAASDLELIVKRDPTDKVSLASLIRAYLEYAPELAEKYASYLPPLPLSQSVDVSRLESFTDFVKPKATAVYVNFCFMFCTRPKQCYRTPVTVSVTKKRKRKPILPKNYDPNVKPDPGVLSIYIFLNCVNTRAITERWLAKRDRTAFRKKGKGKKDAVGSGPQGVALPGGFGGTGSANIGRPVAQPAVTTSGDVEMKDAPVTPTASGSKSTTSNKKKKKGRK